MDRAVSPNLRTSRAKMPREEMTRPNNSAPIAPIMLPSARKAEARRTSRKTEVTTTAGRRGSIGGSPKTRGAMKVEEFVVLVPDLRVEEFSDPIPWDEPLSAEPSSVPRDGASVAAHRLLAAFQVVARTSRTVTCGA